MTYEDFCLGCNGPLGEDYEDVGDAGFVCKSCADYSVRLTDLQLRVIAAFEKRYKVKGASLRRRDPDEVVVETTWYREVAKGPMNLETLEALLARLSV